MSEWRRKSPAMADGYYDAMLEWLRTEVLR